MNKQTQEALKMAGYELDGVIADVEKFDGFDDVCLQTIKRVRSTIAEALEAEQVRQAQEPTKLQETMTKLAKEFIAEQEAKSPQEASEQAPCEQPVAWRYKFENDLQWQFTTRLDVLAGNGLIVEALYPHHARSWKNLTKEEMESFEEVWGCCTFAIEDIQASLKVMNT